MESLLLKCYYKTFILFKKRTKKHREKYANSHAEQEEAIRALIERKTSIKEIESVGATTGRCFFTEQILIMTIPLKK